MFTALGPGEGKAAQKAIQDFSKCTEIDITSNDFTDRIAALKFYNDLGFLVEEFPMYSGDYAFSTGSFIPDSVEKTFIHIFISVRAWILTPKA